MPVTADQIPDRMRAVTVSAPGRLEITEVATPAPGPGEVLVRVSHCGICGTDSHVEGGEYSPVDYPVILGHEFSGTIVDVGSQVASHSIGDRVVVDPSLYCGECAYCLTERENLCERGGGLGTTSPGAAAEYVVAQARRTFAIPDSLDALDAVLVEPLACVVHGFQQLSRESGADYLIYGAGTMGLLTAAMALRSGAGSVSIVDLSEERLRVAQSIGVHETSLSAADLSRSDRGWHVVIDCTGAVSAIADGLSRLRSGGRYLQIGVANPEATVSIRPFELFKREISLVGSRAVRNNFEAAIALLTSGGIPTRELISERIGLEDFPRGLELLRKGTGKVVVSVG